MKEELNLPCLYKVSRDSRTFIFSFTTKNYIEYKVAFVDNLNLFEDTSTFQHIRKIYSLNIEKESIAIEPFDRSTQEAVNCIITEFFKDKENSLLYSCDTSDSKEILRKKKFEKWYDESPDKNSIIRLDAELGESPVNYTSFLYHIENPFREFLEISYDEVVESLKK